MASKPAHETRIGADAPLEFVMPDVIEYPDLALVQIDGIPLYLIPRAIKEHNPKEARSGCLHRSATGERTLLHDHGEDIRAPHLPAQYCTEAGGETERRER